MSSAASPVKVLAENALNGTNNNGLKRTDSGPLGKQEHQISYVIRIMGCVPGRGHHNCPGSEPPLLVNLLTSSDHLGHWEELNSRTYQRIEIELVGGLSFLWQQSPEITGMNLGTKFPGSRACSHVTLGRCIWASHEKTSTCLMSY